MKTRLTRLVVAAGLVLGAMVQAQAAGYCNTNSASVAAPLPGGSVDAANGLAVTDVTYNSSNAENCYGVVSTQGGNNDSASDINTLGLFGQTNWAFLAKAESSNSWVDSTGAFNGYSFKLETDNGTSGDWTLTVTAGTPLPVYLDFIVVLKGSTGYGAYLFDDVAVNAGANGGDWEMKIKNNGGNIADLSHFSVYVRQGEGGGGGDDETVPEPATLALLGLALGGLSLTRRRRKAG